MKIVLLLVLLLIGGIAYAITVRRRVAREAAAAALARARASRRPKVPAVSNSLKGVTASQTMEPFRPKSNGSDGRAA